MGTIKGWTNYPFVELGDTSRLLGPMRKCEVLTYDGDKYCEILIEGYVVSAKRGYIFPSTDDCRKGTPSISWEHIGVLPRPPWQTSGWESYLPITEPAKVVDYLLSILRSLEDKHKS